MKFLRKIPHFIESALQTLKKNRASTQGKTLTPNQPRRNNLVKPEKYQSCLLSLTERSTLPPQASPSTNGTD